MTKRTKKVGVTGKYGTRYVIFPWRSAQFSVGGLQSKFFGIFIFGAHQTALQRASNLGNQLEVKEKC
jgi:hypothetical protein